MNNYIQIFVDAKPLDLPPTENLNLSTSYYIDEEDDTGATGATTDFAIPVPATKGNTAIFSDWAALGTTDLSGAKIKPSFFRINGVPYFHGKAQLRSVGMGGNHYSRKPDSYKIVFWSGNGDWIQQLGDTLLRDLDWSDMMHIYDEPTVRNGFTATSVDNYGYMPIRAKDWSLPGSVTFLDCVPFVFIKTFLYKIFTTLLGYTIDSNFFNSTRTGVGLIMPIVWGEKVGEQYSKDYLNAAAEKTTTRTYTDAVLLDSVDFTAYTIVPPLASPNPITLSAVDPYFALPNSGFYTAPIAMFAKVRISVTVDNISDNGILNVAVISSGVFAGSPSLVVNLTAGTDDGKTFSYEVILELSAGQYIVPVIRLSTISSLDVTFFSFDVIGEAKIADGLNVDFQYFLKDWKAADFIVGLAQALNLRYDANSATKRILIEPHDNYLHSQPFPVAGTTIEQGYLLAPTIDSTPKIDLAKDGELMSGYSTPRYQIFSYKEDSADNTVQNANNKEFLKMAAAQYALPEGFKETKKERENVFFAATMHVFDATVQTTTTQSLSVPQFPLFWDGDFNESQSLEKRGGDFAPRLLFFAGQRSTDDTWISFYRYDLAAKSDIGLPFAFAVNFNDRTGLDPNLYYQNQVINGFEVKGLAERYFVRDMARLRGGKRQEDWLNLKISDILALSFRKKLLINGQNYLLLGVEEFNPLTKDSTRIVMQYDQIDEPIDYDSFTGSNISGLNITYL